MVKDVPGEGGVSSQRGPGAPGSEIEDQPGTGNDREVVEPIRRKPSKRIRELFML